MDTICEKVSVIIPTFNRSDLLKKAVESLQMQSYDNLEIIIVDDCSSDDTQEVVQGFNDLRVIYVRHEVNKGGAEARNTGISHASGNFIGFLDSDDQWLPEKLAKQLALFEKNQDTGVVYTGVTVVDGSKTIREIVPLHRGKLLPQLIESNYIDTTSSILVKKKFLDQVKGFDSSLLSCQDWDLYLRLAQVTTFDYVKEPLVLFNQHEGERITTNKKSVLQGHLHIYKNYKKLARAHGDEVFQKFSLNLSRVILRIGILSQDKKTVRLSREIMSEGLRSKPSAYHSLFLYMSTFIDPKVLLFVYKHSKKSYRTFYSTSKPNSS